MGFQAISAQSQGEFMSFKLAIAALAAICALGGASAQAAVIYSNLGPGRVFNKHMSVQLSPYTSANGSAYSVAMAFTAADTADVSEISLAIGVFFGDPAMEVSLWSRDYTTQLGSWEVTGSSAWSPTLVTISGISGVHLQAGAEYALLVSSLGNEWGTWFDNSAGALGLGEWDASGYVDGVVGAYEILGVVTAVPEPATWAMMIIGFGVVGTVVRRRRSSAGAPAIQTIMKA